MLTIKIPSLNIISQMYNTYVFDESFAKYNNIHIHRGIICIYEYECISLHTYT